MMYDGYLEFAKDMAYQAGKIIKQNFANGMEKDWKSDNTPVTETDLAINKLLIQQISKKFPGHSILAEEENQETDSEYTWVCDPVDGTVPFSHGLPISTFSLALVKNGKSIVGVVYDPYLDRLFYASEGTGAFLNGKKIHVSSKDNLKNALLDVAHNYHEHAPANLEGLQLKLFKVGAQATSLWSVILPSSLVAAGEFTATIFNWTKPVDAAAVAVIVKEAGGKFTDLFGQEQRYDQPVKGFVASNGLVHDQLIKIIKETVEQNADIRD